ncbi:MAG: ELM1/GtrOC1 family putative glycosyltransferase [Candidatus Omnitrophota bacterium]
MKNLFENILYPFVRVFGFVVRMLPDKVALWLGRVLGVLAYYFGIKHKSLAYGNLKIAFAKTKTPDEIKKITKGLFRNFGQNLIELFRLPLMDLEKFRKYVKVEGEENIAQSLQQGKGVILLAMHFGSWELASLSCAMFGHPYKVIVKLQKKYQKLDNLLNSYRSCGGNVVLSRGLGTRELVKSLRNNEIVGMVVDQGGKDGVLIPFFGRHASMSVGAIRMGLKFGVPICFTIIIREKGISHRMIIHKPLDLVNTGNVEQDVITNLAYVAKVMEHYVAKYPSEYMWFYKIWKYSKEATVAVLNDGKTGHLRQSQTVAKLTQQALSERDIRSEVKVLDVSFKNRYCSRWISLFGLCMSSFIYQGRLESLKWFLTRESFEQLMSVKADFIISCGSSVAAINWFLSEDQGAKSIVILKPGLLSFRKFDLVILPQHDVPGGQVSRGNTLVIKGAPNLIDQEYLRSQSEQLTNRYSHLKLSQRMKIGLLIGGDTKYHMLSEADMRMIVNQIKEVAEQANADILATTSRRTSGRVENLMQKELKAYARCPLLIIANRLNIPEAVGGILGLADIVIVSGDSISMIAEAASAGKNTIVFSLAGKKDFSLGLSKHNRFIEKLASQGFIVSTNPRNIGGAIYNIAKNKMHTRRLDDNPAILEAVRYVI